MAGVSSPPRVYGVSSGIDVTLGAELALSAEETAPADETAEFAGSEFCAAVLAGVLFPEAEEAGDAELGVSDVLLPPHAVSESVIAANNDVATAFLIILLLFMVVLLLLNLRH